MKLFQNFQIYTNRFNDSWNFLLTNQTFICSRFYEISCKEGVLDSPCKYVNKKVESRCIQKYSYTYALVKNSPELKNNNSPTFPTREDGAAYVLDYIQIRSGCSCEVKKRKKRSKQKRLFPKNWWIIFSYILISTYQRRTLLTPPLFVTF